MSTLTGLFGLGGSSGGGGGTPINGIAKLNVNGNLYTDENSQVWLRGGNFLTSGFEEYPDAETFQYNAVGSLLSNGSVKAAGTSFNTLFFKPDGTKMYVGNQNTSTGIQQYTLSTPYDISTATLSGSSGNPSYGCYGLYISSDGTKGFFNSEVFYVRSFTMSTAWDITTASFGSTYDINTMWGSDVIFYISGVSANSTGTRLYLTGTDYAGSTRQFFQLTMSTAWDLSTLSPYANRTFSDSLSNYLGGLFISNDQQTMFIAESNFAKITKFTGNATSDGNGMYFATTGTTSTTPTITSDSKKKFSFMGTSKIGVTTQNDVYQVDLSTSLDTTTMSYNSVRTFGLRGLVANNIYGIFFGDSGNKMYLSTSTSSSYMGTIVQLNSSSPYSISSPTLGTSLNVTTKAFFINFSSDGTRLYTNNYSSNTFNQRTLSTPWDISTAGSETSTTLSQFTGNARFTLSSDGTMLFVFYSQSVLRYSLSTPFDITTNTYINSVSITGGTGTYPYWMDADYIYAYGTNYLTIYKMATQWDPTVYTLFRDLNIGATISSGQVVGNGLYYTTTTTIYERELPLTIGLANPDYDTEFLRIK